MKGESVKPVLVFDYDGTLHETMRVYKPGIEAAVRWLRSEHGVEVSMPSDQRMKKWLGMNTAEMWEDFMPGLSPSLKAEAGKLLVSGRRRKAGYTQAEGLYDDRAQQL